MKGWVPKGDEMDVVDVASNTIPPSCILSFPPSSTPFTLYGKLVINDLHFQNALESMRSRIINFEGEFKPVKWKCRAPMPTGKLCERMDRIKVS